MRWIQFGGGREDAGSTLCRCWAGDVEFQDCVVGTGGGLYFLMLSNEYVLFVCERSSYED